MSCEYSAARDGCIGAVHDMDSYSLFLLCDDLHLKWLYFWFFSIPERCRTCPYCQHNCMHLETVTYKLTGVTSHICEFDMAREDRYESPCVGCRDDCGTCPM